ncbi:hypothetical protein SAMN02982929_07061, partial [Saccharopolyspora kobensis]
RILVEPEVLRSHVFPFRMVPDFGRWAMIFSLVEPGIALAALLVGVALAPIKRVVARVVFLAVYLAVLAAPFTWLVVEGADWRGFLILGVIVGPGFVVSAFRIVRAITRKK